MFSFLTPIPLSLYIHIPWCIRKCPYCDFNSHEKKNDLPEELYIDTLIRDLDEQLPSIWGRRFISIFFGGGTPSLFKPKSIEKILLQIQNRIPFNKDIEITLEANPGTIDTKHFKGYRAAGINRLSIGIQSLQNEKLTLLGRIHDRDHALRAIENALHAGFDNFNLDFMHGLPNQSSDDAKDDIKDALQFNPPHFSWYQLTIEPNTFFHFKPPSLPTDDTLWDIQTQGKNIITKNHLSQYEISAYAKKGYECVHNTNYWEFGDYLGIGAGAHSKITHFEKEIISRHWQVKNPKIYLDPNKTLTAEQTILSEKDVVFEFMLNALRLTNGIRMDLFSERTGLPITKIIPFLEKAKIKGMLEYDQNFLKPTELGLRFLNDLVGLFL